MNLRLTRAEADMVWSELQLKALSYKRWADYEGLSEEVRQGYSMLAQRALNVANKIGAMLGRRQEQFGDD